MECWVGGNEFVFYFGRLISKSSKKNSMAIEPLKEKRQFKSHNQHLEEKKEEDQYVSNEIRHEKDTYQRWKQNAKSDTTRRVWTGIL